MQQVAEKIEDATKELYLDKLNEAQCKAVQTTEGPLLVLAGAGTGKTKVLTTRIAHILKKNLAFPNQILAVTFTNKAAREMRERIAGMVGEATSSGLWLGTFHSICLRILRKHCEHIGLKNDFAILDIDDQVRLIKQILIDNNLDEKRFPPKSISITIQRWKDRGLTPDKVAATGDTGPALNIYEIYQKRLLTLNSVDFGDLLLYSITLFTSYPDILAEYHRRFRYIMVDEYQDTNISQYLWLRLLAQGNHNICCVGDDDQSIYGWRGAEIDNILRFERDFSDNSGKKPQIIRLEQNYRSTPEILAAASSVISNNKGRLGKTLFCDQDKGNKTKIVSLWDERAEADFVGREIEAQQQIYKHRLNKIAILVRAGFQTRSFEECFISMGVPYKVIGGLRFYERMEIRDAIAYIRAVIQPSNDLALERIINTPKRGIGDLTVDELRKAARSNNISLSEEIKKQLLNNSLKARTHNSLSSLMNNIVSWRKLFSEITHYEAAERILLESGYIDMWRNDKSPDSQGRVENLKELIAALQDFENIEQFLEHVSLVTDNDEELNTEMVSIMTMHGAKGLEFDTVFLTGWEEGLFPSQRSMDENGAAGLEEERRLAYVGITRAKKNLFITFAANRRVYGQWISSIPSRFIDELPSEAVEIINASGTGYKREEKRTPWLPSKNTPPSSISAQPVAALSGKDKKFSTGERIFHQKFGYGHILNISGSHIKIAFEKAGVKILMEDYINKVT